MKSVVRLAVGVLAAFLISGAMPALAAPFTVSYSDGGTWNTVYAQGFSPSVSPNPDPGLSAGDPVNLTQFLFEKSGTADSASNIQLAIINNMFGDLTGLNTSSPLLVGLSSNTIASTAAIATGDPIAFTFNNLPLTYGNDYAAVFVNVDPSGNITPVQVSAMTANYVDAGGGDYHPQTNYGTESQYQYSTSNYISTNQYGSFFSSFSYAGDANFATTLQTVPEPASASLLLIGMAGAALRRRGANAHESF